MKIEYKKVKKWYLEMTEAPKFSEIKFPSDSEIKLFNGTCEDYRSLNKLIGGDLGWIDRQIMPDEELSEIIKNHDVKIFVLYYLNEEVGYTEIDYRSEEEVILQYFGLAQNARGKGFGKFLLFWTINEVWKFSPKKLKLTTLDSDHPHALPNYLKAGFVIINEQIEKQAFII